MATSPARHASQKNSVNEDVRDQEGLRAFRELAAYFKGQRTEREARAALKILKAFIRERERLDPAKRRPLSRQVASSPARPRRQKKKSPAALKIHHGRTPHQESAADAGLALEPTDSPPKN